ncbi:MAG: HAMP domain-containing histidine kinase [Anaerolineae bacterium]|nr:HAMP domain-containing histidine kinase [Anaerolineae bacterium]
MTTEPIAETDVLDQLLSRAHALVEELRARGGGEDAVLDELGSVLAAIGAEREHLQAELQAAHALRQSSGELMNTFRNELLSPMEAVKSYVEIMLHTLPDPLSRKQMRLLNSIVKYVEQETELVRNFSDIVHIREGFVRVVPYPVRLKDVMRSVQINTEDYVHDRSHELTVHIPDDLPALWADAHRLEQVMTHLLKNACQYSPDESKINVYAAAVDGGVRITVMDTGVGMSHAQLGRLGEPFYRGYNPNVLAQPGAGLGFHIARRLVRMMGGEITVLSELNEGTTISFTLPTADNPPKTHEFSVSA